MKDREPATYRKSKKPILYVVGLILLFTIAIIALPSRSPDRPGLEPFLSQMLLVHAETHAPVGVKVLGRPVQMTPGFVKVYTVHKPFAEVIAAAKKAFKPSNGWFDSSSRSPAPQSVMFSFNDKTKKNPLPWEISDGVFSYVMVVIQSGRAKEIPIGTATLIESEKEAWTTIIVSDDGHPQPVIDRVFPFLHPDPKPTGMNKSWTVMPSPRVPGGPID